MTSHTTRGRGGPTAQALTVSSGIAILIPPRPGPSVDKHVPRSNATMWHVTAEKAMKGRLEPPCNPIFLDTPVFKKYWSCQKPSSQTLPICTFDCGM